MKSKRRFLAATVVPIALLMSGLGLGLVLADEAPYPAPDGQAAFEAAPNNLLRETRPNRVGPSRAERRKASAQKRKCKRERGAAKGRCLNRVEELLQPTVAKTMSENKARDLADRRAEAIFTNDVGVEDEGLELWTDYGLATSRCRELKDNSRVCAAFVAFVDDDPYSSDYLSSYECQFVVKSTFLVNGDLEVKDSFRSDRVCEWTNEGGSDS